MNENEMLNPTAVETNEAAVAAVPEENVNAAPVTHDSGRGLLLLQSDEGH